jgi:hypothetical protein
MEDRELRQYIEERIVEIREVNMPQQKIVVRDQFGSILYISLHLLEPHVAIPKVGELWTARRQGVDWILNRRRETGEEAKSIATLEPGDHRIESLNNVYIHGKNVIIGSEEGEETTSSETDQQSLQSLINASVASAVSAVTAVKPRCVVTRATNFTLSNSAWQLITWDGEAEDPFDMHNSTNPARITIPQTGVYMIGFNITPAGDGSQTLAGFQIQLNTEATPGAAGTNVCYQAMAGVSSGGIAVGWSASNVHKFNAGDYLAMAGFQNGTGTWTLLTANPNRMWAVML